MVLTGLTGPRRVCRAAICLCGTAACRGSFLYFAGNKAFMQVLNERHSMLHRQAILLRAASEPLNQDDRRRLDVRLIPLASEYSVSDVT